MPLLSNVLNPKIAIFFLAYLPQFADPSAGGMAPQLLALGLTFPLLTRATSGVIAIFLGDFGRMAKEASKVRGWPGLADGRRPDRAGPAARPPGAPVS